MKKLTLLTLLISIISFNTSANIPILNLPQYSKRQQLKIQPIQNQNSYWSNDYSCGAKPATPSYCYGYGNYYCQCHTSYCQWVLIGCN